MNVPNRLVALATACLGLAALLVVATLPRPVIGQNWPAWREQWVQVLDAAFFAACLLLTVGLLHTRRAAQRAGREPSAGGRQPDVYAMLVESTPMPMLCLDASLRCVVVNEAFAGLLRKGRASLVGQSAGDCLTPAMRDALLPEDRKSVV